MSYDEMASSAAYKSARQPADEPADGPADEPYDPLRAYYEDGASDQDEEIASTWSRRSFAHALLAALERRQQQVAEAFVDRLCEGSVQLFKLIIELEREAAEEQRQAEEKQAPTLAQLLLPLLRRDLIPQKEAERKAAQQEKFWEKPPFVQPENVPGPQPVAPAAPPVDLQAAAAAAAPRRCRHSLREAYSQIDENASHEGPASPAPSAAAASAAAIRCRSGRHRILQRQRRVAPGVGRQFQSAGPSARPGQLDLRHRPAQRRQPRTRNLLRLPIQPSALQRKAPQRMGQRWSAAHCGARAAARRLHLGAPKNPGPAELLVRAHRGSHQNSPWAGHVAGLLDARRQHRAGRLAPLRRV